MFARCGPEWILTIELIQSNVQYTILSGILQGRPNRRRGLVYQLQVKSYFVDVLVVSAVVGHIGGVFVSS